MLEGRICFLAFPPFMRCLSFWFVAPSAIFIQSQWHWWSPTSVVASLALWTVISLSSHSQERVPTLQDSRDYVGLIHTIHNTPPSQGLELNDLKNSICYVRLHIHKFWELGYGHMGHYSAYQNIVSINTFSCSSPAEKNNTLIHTSMPNNDC
jgi:hypothetical protein